VSKPIFASSSAPLIDCPRKTLDALARLLARRDHSEQELRQKLRRRYAPEAIEQALYQAHRRKWLADPEVLANRWAETLSRKGKSDRYIQNFLKQKKLPPTKRNPETEISKAVALLKQKFKNVDKFDFQAIQKAYRILGNRGFDESTCRLAIQEFRDHKF
jgi:regulatory protein